ncbi:hypothetical protein MTR67_000066 [Solanum verrucosum]|uniref:EF-hand domain-containing protein n=1 Tax=Solanum verrucosum TaxID=315347 RepID=A0AAF0T668_SOLVR|nr:probable calcium-binding protein CML25 [Solanum verrucosum]WMV06681.1 hypothetical protein MTR67_000066 [Solanum verrucosum]
MGLIKSLFNGKKKNDPTPANSPPVNSPVMIEEELQQVFDINGDGKISFSELGFIMASLGTAITEEESIEMINEVDGDGDGFIDLREVMENLKDAFSVFDVDKNGSISAEELQKVMKSIGEECSLDKCRKMIGGVDCDGDGMIDFEEFKVMMIGKRKKL